MKPLSKEDFPIISVGANVYRRTESSPMFTASSPELADDIATRLNRDDQSGFGYRSVGSLVYG